MKGEYMDDAGRIYPDWRSALAAYADKRMPELLAELGLLKRAPDEPSEEETYEAEREEWVEITGELRIRPDGSCPELLYGGKWGGLGSCQPWPAAYRIGLEQGKKLAVPSPEALVESRNFARKIAGLVEAVESVCTLWNRIGLEASMHIESHQLADDMWSATGKLHKAAEALGEALS